MAELYQLMEAENIIKSLGRRLSVICNYAISCKEQKVNRNKLPERNNLSEREEDSQLISEYNRYIDIIYNKAKFAYDEYAKLAKNYSPFDLDAVADAVKFAEDLQSKETHEAMTALRFSKDSIALGGYSPKSYSAFCNGLSTLKRSIEEK